MLQFSPRGPTAIFFGVGGKWRSRARLVSFPAHFRPPFWQARKMVWELSAYSLVDISLIFIRSFLHCSQAAWWAWAGKGSFFFHGRGCENWNEASNRHEACYRCRRRVDWEEKGCLRKNHTRKQSLDMLRKNGIAAAIRHFKKTGLSQSEGEHGQRVGVSLLCQSQKKETINMKTAYTTLHFEDLLSNSPI